TAPVPLPEAPEFVDPPLEDPEPTPPVEGIGEIISPGAGGPELTGPLASVSSGFAAGTGGGSGRGSVLLGLGLGTPSTCGVLANGMGRGGGLTTGGGGGAASGAAATNSTCVLAWGVCCPDSQPPTNKFPAVINQRWMATETTPPMIRKRVRSSVSLLICGLNRNLGNADFSCFI